ncbi:MAG: heparinase II/III-family protein [Chloroflexaceae bacterium]|nr:heparinase II/III-family protein [Chloroflexaceae bacterium]
MSCVLFLGDKTIEQWREAANSTHAARLARLLEQADSYLTWQPPTEHPRETITYIGMAAANLALAFLLTEQPRYLQAARRWVGVAVGYPHWGKAHMPDHDLDAGWLCFGLGLAYNWLGAALPGTEREALRNKLLLQGQRLYNFARDSEGRWWSSAYWQNHNWICYAGLATAAYALELEQPETAAWAARAQANFQTVMALLPEDGSDYEGVVYWCYGLPWLLIGCDLFAQHGTIDLHDSPFLRHSFAWRMALSGPNLVDTANFGDCHDRRSAHAAAICYWLAARYRDGHAQWLAAEFERNGEWQREGREGLLRPGTLPQAFLELLWYDPTVEPEPLASLPRTRLFPDMGLVSARSSWEADATLLVFKCGKPSGQRAWAIGHGLNQRRGWDTLKASHAHPDENSFILVRGEDYLAVDEGYSQAKLTRHHSTLLVDGQGQYGEGRYNAFEQSGPTQGGRLEASFAAGSTSYMRGEAAAAYNPALGLRRFTRQIVAAGLRTIVLCDDLASDEPRAFSWLLQTDTPAAPVAGGYLVRAGSSQLRVVPLLPHGLQAANEEEEIVAYPSSSTPEWVLRHRQHRLALTTDRSRATRMLTLLHVEGADETAPTVQQLKCTAGDGVRVHDNDGSLLVAFAADARGIQLPGELASDAAWLTVSHDEAGQLLSLAAGGVTQLWVGGQLRCEAATPVTLAWDERGWHVESPVPVWVSLWIAAPPVLVLVNGEAQQGWRYMAELALLRLQLPPGHAQVLTSACAASPQ